MKSLRLEGAGAAWLDARCRRWLIAIIVVLVGLRASRAEAQCVVTPYIVVDGQTCDWTASQRPVSYTDTVADPPGVIDLQTAQVTDNYNTASTGNGNIYGRLTFAVGSTFPLNAEVGLMLNIPGGPAPDPACNSNYTLAFQCTKSPCTNSANWSATFFTNLSGASCQTAQSGVALQMNGANQRAAFAINGNVIEFGANIGSLGSPTTFGVTPYSTSNLTSNAPLDMLGQQTYVVTSSGPTAATVARLTAKAGRGVTLGWVTESERGNLGFWLWRSRGGAPWVRVNGELIRGQMSSFSAAEYRYFDPQGRAGDLYRLSDVDRRTGALHTVAPVAALAGVELPVRQLAARKAMSPRILGRVGEAARLGVSHEGMYRISAAELAAAGIQLGGDAELSYGGEPMALTRSGSDWVFYAGPIQNQYDGVDAYLLRPGHGVTSTRPRPPRAGSFVTTAASQLSLHEAVAYNWYTGGDDPYIWAWASNLFPEDPVAFDAPAAVPWAGGYLDLGLVGGTAFGHHVQVRLNGTTLGELSWTGNGDARFAADLPAGLLRPSGNSLVVAALYDTGAPFEYVMLRSVDVSYGRAPLAVGGEARFDLPSGQCAAVAGLGAGADGWDVTDPASVVPGVAFMNAGRLVVCSPRDGFVHRVQLFDQTAFQRPSARPLTSSRLREADSGADEVIIVHPSLAASLGPLVAARRAQGLAVVVATLDEVDDAFGAGSQGRAPIRDFLAFAHQHWRLAPRYVLLVGGANADVRDVMHTGVANLIPSGVVVAGPEAMRAASDSWFVTGSDGLTPQVAIGRLAVDSPAQAVAVIAKLLAGDHQGPATGSAVLAHDVATRADDADFALESASVGEQLTTLGLAPVTLSAGQVAPGQSLAGTLGDGVNLWHYVGHAGTAAWGAQQWFRAADMTALRNQRLPVLTSFDCLDGMFDNPTTVSMGWAAVANPSGGALASFVPSTVLSPREAHPFNLLVMRGLMAPQHTRIGDGLLWAQRQAAADPVLADHVRTYNLLGDPASTSPLR